MLSAQTIATVKSTIPLLESAGVAITDHFYQRMFRLNPELKNIFNMANQANGRQQFALFNAIAAYAKNIDNLGALSEVVERVAHKHTSFFIQPEHYDIVGHHLIETLRELAPEAFTPDVEQAWVEAYGALAGIFINREGDLYSLTEKAQGGWLGPRQFRVLSKTPESALVTSFVLAPVDSQPVIDYKPGQYLGVKVKPAGAEYEEIRQYSISQKSNAKNYRISVKKECQPKPGVVSNYLHSLEQGARVELYPPAGDVILKNEATPVVLISAGVGQTPMMAMLQTLLSGDKNQAISYLHACENSREFSFKGYLAQQTAMHPQLKTFTWFNQGGEECDFTGLMDLTVLEASLPISEGAFYLCGPASFMAYVKGQLLDLGVQSSNIHYEIFGPHQAL